MNEDDWDGKERRMKNGNGEQRSALERHAQTVLATIITLLVSWIGLAVVDLKTKQAETGGITNTKLEQLQKNVESLQSQLIQISADRVTLSDLRRVEDRLDRLERKGR